MVFLYLSALSGILMSVFGGYFSLTVLMRGEGPFWFFSLPLSFPDMMISAKIDSISAFFLLILSAVSLMVSIYSIGYMRHVKGTRRRMAFGVLYPLFLLSMASVFLAGNTLAFFVAWELMTLLSYALILMEGEKKGTGNAGTLYLVMASIGTACLLAAFGLMHRLTGSFEMGIALSGASENMRNLLFLLFVVGFGTKAGLVPFHVWLPYAHPAAPSNVSALMSGIMIKTAVYGVIRFVFDTLGMQTPWWAILLLVLGIFSTLYGVAYAFVEKNIKKMLAYSSIENMGILFTGLGLAAMGMVSGNEGLRAIGLMAAMVHLVNHALFKTLLFLGAGSVDSAIHTRNLEEMGGLMKLMPYTGLFMVAGALSLAAVLPFNGFIGEWFTFQAFLASVQKGSFLPNILAVFGIGTIGLSGALAVGTAVKLIGIGFLGRARSEKAGKAAEVGVSMVFAKGVLAMACLVLGMFPGMTVYLVGMAFGERIGLPFPVLEGWKFAPKVMFQPLVAGNNTILPYVPLALFLVVVLLVIVLRRLFGGRTREVIYNTWDCGFDTLTKRMQTSAMGLSKPVEMAMKLFYRPFRRVYTTTDPTGYFPREIKVESGVSNLFEKYLYQPLIRLGTRRAKGFKFGFQTGSTHLYLIYMFLMLFALLIYNRVV